MAMSSQPSNVVDIQKLDSSKDGVQKGRKVKDQSLEMLKVRVSLEEKLKQKGLYSHITPKPSNSLKRLRPANGQLETCDDFDDDAMAVTISEVISPDGMLICISCSYFLLL